MNMNIEYEYKDKYIHTKAPTSGFFEGGKLEIDDMPLH